MRRLVFVPLIGSTPVEDWTTVPHVKAWGLWDDETDELDILHLENANASSVNVARNLFEAEKKLITDVEEFDPLVPDVVYARLAQDTLNPSVRED